MNISFIFIFYVIILTDIGQTDNTKNILNLDLSNFYKYININNTTKFLRNKKNSELCVEHIRIIRQGLQNGEKWSLEFIDSWGKIPSGILWGHLADLGNFEECLNSTKPNQNPSNDALKGKYCTAKIPIGKLLSNRPIVIPFEFQGFAETIEFNKIPPISIGVCVPNSCDPESLNEMMKLFLKNILNIKLDEMDEIIGHSSCAINYQEQSFQAIYIFAICFFSIIVLIMMLSTIYDYFIQHIKVGIPNNLLAAFSVYSNGKKLFKIHVNKSENVIGCLNGIRCLSMSWVIIGHRYAVASTLPFINSIKIFDWYSTGFSLLIQNATVSVDSFFLLSGLLIAWIGFRQLEKNKGKLNIPLMYFHRYIRLTPVVAVVILIMVSLFKYSATGPFWYQWNIYLMKICEKNWWQTLIYVQNYVNPDEICLMQTWYLAVDTQLYLISPIFLLLTWKWGKKFIYPTAIILMLLSIGCCFATFLKYEFSMTRTQPQNQTVQNRRNELIYFPTHTRISPWLVGLVLGYFMYEHKGQRFRMSKIIVFFGWFFSFTIIAAIIFGTYPRVQLGSYATPLEGAFYESLSRVSWSLALGWIVFACHNGYGGFINLFLSYPLWQILSRLTYSMYLTHILIVAVNAGSIKTSIHFTNYEMQFMFLGDFFITILISVVMVLAFELPILGIEKTILRTEENKSKTISQRNLVNKN